MTHIDGRNKDAAVHPLKYSRDATHNLLESMTFAMISPRLAKDGVEVPRPLARRHHAW